jgi:Mn-dependent DtxR family transcriptional regulator
MMLKTNEVLLIQQLAIFADTNNVNKSDIARKTGVSPRTVRNIINKFKECKINVKK